MHRHFLAFLRDPSDTLGRVADVNEINATNVASLLSKESTPVLTWLGPKRAGGEERERVELSGPVARRWLAKTDNFLDQEFPYGAETFVALLPTFWRSPFWLLAPWLRGLKMVSPRDAADADLVVSNDLGFLEGVADEGGPDAIIAQTLESFELAWPGGLPAEILDGTADILSYGDEVEAPKTASPDTVIVADAVDWLPPGLWEDTSKKHMTLGDLGEKTYLQAEGAPPAGGSLSEDRVLVTTDNLTLFSAQLFQLWMAGASVVWVPGGGDDLDEIIEVEQVTNRLPNKF